LAPEIEAQLRGKRLHALIAPVGGGQGSGVL
jgi:hypothetical protein